MTPSVLDFPALPVLFVDNLVTAEEKQMVINAAAMAIALKPLQLDSEVQEAKGLLADLAAFHDDLEDRRVALKKPYLEGGRAVDEAFGHALTQLKGAQSQVKLRLTDWANRQAAAKAEADRQAAAQVAAGEVPPITPAVVATRTPTVKVATTTRTEYVVVDQEAIPRKFLIPDMRAIAEAFQRGEAIPGVQRQFVQVAVNR